MVSLISGYFNPIKEQSQASTVLEGNLNTPLGGFAKSKRSEWFLLGSVGAIAVQRALARAVNDQIFIYCNKHVLVLTS